MKIQPTELAALFRQGATFQMLDVRAPEKVASDRIDLPAQARFINIRGSQVRNMTSLDQMGIERAFPVVTVCGQGNDSLVVAAHLKALGADARSLDGGMAAWSHLSVPRELPPSDGLDTLLQFDRLGKASLSYVLISDKQAIIIDPPRDMTPHFRAIRDAGADLVGVADTHVHADYISGAPSVAAEYGLLYYLHPADAVYPYDGTPGTLTFHAISDGDAIPLGRTAINVMHTPGHTEGSVTYLVGDELAFTGDFIFIASIGRPDLAGRTKEWTIDLWKSLQRTRTQLSADCRILPAHYANHGERNDDWSIARPFGHLLTSTRVFRMEKEEEFLAWVLQKEASFPEAYRMIKSINVGLTKVSDDEADVLEVGKNECAIG